jgi:hypothetical protein
MGNTLIRPGEPQAEIVTFGESLHPFHPCAHPCSLAAGVGEEIAAPPWLEGMPAGGS